MKKEEESQLLPEETTAERVKLRRQKANYKDLFYTSSRSTDDDSDEFSDILDMPPLESDEKEVREGNGLKILTPNY